MGDLLIERVEIYEAKLLYRQPFTISLGTSTYSVDVIAKVYDDEGNVGLGETSPSRKILGESEHTIEAAMRDIAPILIGEDPERLELIEERMDKAILGNTAAKLALEMAVIDLIGKRRKIPLWRMLGGYREKIETDFTIGIKNPEEMAKDAVELVSRGFRILKLKVGTSPEEDLARVKAVRDAVGNSIRIRIDANQGWSVKTAVKVLNEMQRYDVELAEQPVKWNDIEGMAEVRMMSPIPIMADESVHTPEDALKVAMMEAADYINIKLTKAGGILKARRIAEISEAAGIPNMIGCMMEGGISITAAVHFACGMRNVVTSDLDSDISLKQDVVEDGSAKLENGYRIPPDEPGLGNLRLRDDMLKYIATYKERSEGEEF
ncbi:MAG: mandelate racemase/muconate lactonizing enzyme family protein [Candidatus Methanodesulfokora washburnensis]|jgi:L-alanine-DL-glutamate epimerase-like enolase superfamily enzyme